MTLMLLSDYTTQKEIAIDAWNTGESIKAEIKEKYSQRSKECLERFDTAINNMINILFDQNKAESINRALMIIGGDLQDRLSNFPKSERGLAAHVNEDTKRRRLLVNFRGQSEASLPPIVSEESSVTEPSLVQANETQTTLQPSTGVALVLSDLEVFDNIGYHPRPYDVWNFQMDDRFGLRYPGNIPAGIVFNTLYFFSEPGQLIVDPMAGGGVVGDCCKEVNRRCFMYDIQPIRNDVIQYDISHGLPAEAANADLLFWDPPYYKKMQAEYGDKSISSFDRKQYLSVFASVAKEAYKKGIKKIALLMSNYDDEYNDATGNSNIFIRDYIDAITESTNWRMHREIQCPLSTEQIHVWQPYIEQKQLHRLTRSLIIFVRSNQR